MSSFLTRHQKPILWTLLVVFIAYGFYFWDAVRTTSILNFSLSYALPLILAAMVGIIGERTGVVNIGIEGQMLLSAFVAFFAAVATGSLVIGAFLGMAAGLLAGAFLGMAAVKWEMDQIIAGVVINIVAAGITSFYYTPGKSLPSIVSRVEIPLLSDIPLIGQVFFNKSVFVYFTIIVVVFLQIMLFTSKWGLRSRAVGEYPSAADTAGINVYRTRILNVALAGILAGAAGAYLSLDAAGWFERGFTAGRGFLALAIMIFGAWNPLGAMAAALFFGFASGMASQLQADELINIPQQFINMLPYVMTLVVLSFSAGKVRPPGAVGQPYKKEG